MDKNTLSQTKTSFKSLEQNIFKIFCEEAQAFTTQLLEKLDDKLSEQRDKNLYRDKGKRVTTIKTVYGPVSFSRRVYATTLDDGTRAHVFLLDEELEMERIGLASANLTEKILSTVAKSSFRTTAETITSTSGQSISHGGVWNIVQRFGGRLEAEEDKQIQEMNTGISTGKKAIPVLFEEMDGVWISMQGKGAKKAKMREMKVGTIYEGWDANSKNATSLSGKKVVASMGSADEFHEKMESKIQSIYDVERIEQRILNGDGGSWICDPYDPDTIEQLDRYHVIQDINMCIEPREYRRYVKNFLEQGKIPELIESIQIYADSVATIDPDDEREKNALSLKRHLQKHSEKLTRYDERGIDIPKPPQGIVYKHMGVQENQNATLITMRMKKGRRRWSYSGAANMARLLCARENKELTAIIDRYSDGYLPEQLVKEELDTLSAAKAPKKDGKGSIYPDLYGSHMPILDCSNIRTVRMIRNMIG